MNDDEKKIYEQEQWVKNSLTLEMEKNGVMYYLLRPKELKRLQRIVQEIEERRRN